MEQTDEEQNCDVDTKLVNKEKKHKFEYYTLPSFRYVNIFLVLVFIDSIVAVALWLTGGNTDYFIDSVTDFHFRQSVFDLVIIAAIKSVVLPVILTLLEPIAYRQMEEPFNSSHKGYGMLLHILLITSCLLSFAYATTKGGYVLNGIVNDSSYDRMHSEYNAMIICVITFSFLELLLALCSVWMMRRLKLIRILHRLNDLGREVDDDGKPLKKKVDLKRLISLAKPEVWLLFVGLLSMIFASGSQIVAPLFFGKVVDSALKSMDELNRTILILVGIYIIGAFAAMMRSWFFTLAGQRLVARLRTHLFTCIIKQEIAFFDTNRTGELCNRLSSDTQVIQNAVTVNISMLFRYILQVLGSIGFMFYLNASLTGVLLAVVPVVSIGAVQYGKMLRKFGQQFQDRIADAGTTAEESLSSIRTVRMFAAENKVVQHYGSDIDKSYKVGKKMAFAQGLFEGTLGLLSYGAVALVLWYGGKLVHDYSLDSSKGISPGVLTSFLLYTLQVAIAFALLSSLYGDFMKAVGASIRIFELLDRMPELPNSGGMTIQFFDGSVQFQNVKFTYPSRPESKVLHGISFTVDPGQVVALVGPSGGGKSTIVSLIERFYDPDVGSITLGGLKLTTLDPEWFRKTISMVSQEPTLFASSIKDNIAYGRDATMEEIHEVAKLANAHDFISSFEEGYDTLIGERGVRLSGGQKQRIAIARALIMNPSLLLLDEATSALDAESEHLVQEAIDRAMKNRTVIVIAHRLSTVRNASQVIVIDKGQISEQGTHDELLAKDGVYKKLVLRQLTAGTVDQKLLDDSEDEDDMKTIDLDSC